MIQVRPRCFDCESEVTHDPVFAPPFCDHVECSSAVFHPICLMNWRATRDQKRQEVKEQYMAFMRHLAGECDCP